MGGFSLAQEVSKLYEYLTLQVIEKRHLSYESLARGWEELGKLVKTKKGVSQEITESRWRMLPQRVEEWQKENTLALFSLRLKALLAEVGKKPNEAKEAEAELSSIFQSLLYQWETPPSPLPPSLPKKERIIPLSPPQPPKFWWLSPILIGSSPTAGKNNVEQQLEESSLKISQDIEKEKRVFTKEIERYKRILEEVRQRCHLP